ncbi:unnamed protein product, partial [Ectocarpus sp. 12 AP-2014]
MVKRALLADITRLCVFFGFENTLDSILPQLITFLNDRDWSLRAAFCEHIPAVCAMAGEVATTRFILPCIENTLVDAREAVIASGLRCLAALAGLGLLPRHALPSQATPAAPLLQHPGLGVRAGAVELIARVAEALGVLDTQVFLYPVLRPHLRYSLPGGSLDEATLLDALRPPVPRPVFDSAVGEVIEARRVRAVGGGGGGGGGAGDGGQPLQQFPASDNNAAAAGDYRRQAADSRGGGNGGPDHSRTSQQQQQREQQRRNLSGAENGGEGGVVATAEEKEALSLLKGYIDTAAQHAANKGRGTGGGGDGSVAGERSSPVHLPESLSQAIYVPTQKITTLHPGVGAVAVAVATALASGRATSGDGRRDAGRGGHEGGEDDIDLRLSSAALSATPALLQSVT